jgi:RimJ/RimL family protein N-acetyltransferase
MTPLIKGKQLNLRPLQKSDAQDIYENANDPVIAKYTTIPQPYTLQMAEEFILKAQKNLKVQESYELGIEHSGRIVGMMSLMHVNREDRNAEIGYWVGQRFHGRGIGSEALALMLELERIYARVFHPNETSAKLLERAGFKYEGRSRRTKCKNGEWMDDLNYAILRNEFPPQRS